MPFCLECSPEFVAGAGSGAGGTAQIRIHPVKDGRILGYDRIEILLISLVVSCAVIGMLAYLLLPR